jgi:hypothetical protein
MIAELIEEKEYENEQETGGIRGSGSFCRSRGIGRGILLGRCAGWEKAIQNRFVGREGTSSALDAPSQNVPSPI